MSARRASEAVSGFDEQPVREVMSVAHRLSPVLQAGAATLDGVDQLNNALTELLGANDPALASFQTNFYNRTQAVESPESHPAFGLTGILEELLLKKPNDSYYRRQIGAVPARISSQFVSSMRESFFEIGNERPDVIAHMLGYIRTKEVSVREFLQATFRYYDEHEQTFLL